MLEPGTNLARYTILGKLATGGMSEVYLARQSGPSGFSKILVLKVILPHLCEDPEFVSMFHNEAKLAALLNHPNVVQIFDFSVSEEAHFMAMEYIDGQDLGRIIDKVDQNGTELPESEALRIISDACGALEYAHSFTDPGGTHLEIIHRDVSLDNILVTYSGQVKLVDFGIAKARNVESHTAVGTLRGKFNYMAPELLEGLKLDNRVDIFAIGVVLYRALVGQMPFLGDNHAQLINAIVHKTPPAPREVKPDLPEELERIIQRALAKDRDQRYQRAGEVQIDLEAYLLGAGKAVMPYHLAQFMGKVFPPGSDTARERYRKLAGITTTTPGKKVEKKLRDERDTRPVTRPTKDPSSLLFKSTITGEGQDQADLDTARMIEASTMIASEEELVHELVLDDGDMLVEDDELDGIPLQGANLRDAARGVNAPTSVFARTPDRAQVHADEPTVPLDVEALADLHTAELDGALDTLKTGTVRGGSLPPEQGLLGGDTPVDDLAGFGPLKQVSTADEPTRVQDVQVFDQIHGDVVHDDDETAIITDVVSTSSAEMEAPDLHDTVTTSSAEMTAPNVATGGPGTITQDVPALPPEKGRSPMIFVVLGLLLLGGAGGGVYYFGFHDRGVTPGKETIGVVANVDGGPVAPAEDQGAPAPRPDAAEPDPEDAEVPAEPDSAAPVAPDSAVAPKPDKRVAKKPPPRRPKPDMRVKKPPRRPKPDMRVVKKPPPRKPKTGQLSVTCTLSGDVLNGRKKLGKLPLKGAELPPGSHRIQIRSKRLGYAIYRTVTIKAGGHQRLSIAPRTGTLILKVRPWAKVTLDGKSLGTSPIPPKKVYEGFHVLVLTNENLKVKKRMRVKVEPGKETVRKVRLDQ